MCSLILKLTKCTCNLSPVTCVGIYLLCVGIYLLNFSKRLFEVNEEIQPQLQQIAVDK